MVFTNSVTDSACKENVADDIVFEILLRLPAKSILRFRYVPKNWLNTIDSLRFANMHTSTWAAAEELQILPLRDCTRAPKPVHSFIYDGNVIKVRHERPAVVFSEEDVYYSVEHVAYGLVCFRSRNWKIGLFNPFRGEKLRATSYGQ